MFNSRNFKIFKCKLKLQTQNHKTIYSSRKHAYIYIICMLLCTLEWLLMEEKGKGVGIRLKGEGIIK